MGRDRGRLEARSKLLRVSTRKDASEATWVASLAVLDWTADGLLGVIASIHARGGALHICDPGLSIRPGASIHDLQQAVAIFEHAKRRERIEERGRTGGKVSGDRRKAAALERLKPIWDRWVYGDQREHRTVDLLAEAGVTRNTAVSHMKHRKGPR